MENKNTWLKVLVIVLSILVVALSGYLVYDKVLNNNENDKLDSDTDNQHEQYSVSDFSNRVFNSKIEQGRARYYLTLWDDGKYIYTNENHTEETLGTYTIENDRIKLTSLYLIDRGEDKRSSADDFVGIYTTKKQELKIVSLNQIIDEETNIELYSVNQPPNQGGENFDTILEGLTD